jgi:hypothetical protein
MSELTLLPHNIGQAVDESAQERHWPVFKVALTDPILVADFNSRLECL